MRASPWSIDGGTVEAMKWLALLAMTLDHVNTYLLGGHVAALLRAGRLAMPLFGFVLAYNLARPDALVRRVHLRVMRRLLLGGLLATLPLYGLGHALHGWWPLNVMFMLLAATAIIFFIERGGPLAPAAIMATFAAGGALVDFWWFGLLFCLCAWWFCKSASRAAALALLLATAALSFANDGNWWALAALPLILLAPKVTLVTPRVRWVFYAYYPAHLALLLVLARSGCCGAMPQ